MPSVKAYSTPSLSEPLEGEGSQAYGLEKSWYIQTATPVRAMDSETRRMINGRLAMAVTLFQSADLELDQFAFPLDLDDLVASSARPGGDIGEHAGVGGGRFQDTTYGEFLNRFADFDYRYGAEQPFQVKRNFDFVLN